MTGRRPIRSIARPAGTAVSADAVRKIAGPRPRRPSTPVTSTNVIDETAATSWSTAEYTAMAAASSTVLRRTGRWVAVVAKAGILSRAVCHAVATGNWKAVRRLLPMLLAAGSLLASAAPAHPPPRPPAAPAPAPGPPHPASPRLHRRVPDLR